MSPAGWSPSGGMASASRSRSATSGGSTSRGGASRSPATTSRSSAPAGSRSCTATGSPARGISSACTTDQRPTATVTANSTRNSPTTSTSIPRSRGRVDCTGRLQRGEHEEHDTHDQDERQQRGPDPVAELWSHGLRRPSAQPPPAQPAPYNRTIIVDPPAGRNVAWIRHSGRSELTSRTREPSSSGVDRLSIVKPAASRRSRYHVETAPTSAPTDHAPLFGPSGRAAGGAAGYRGKLWGAVSRIVPKSVTVVPAFPGGGPGWSAGTPGTGVRGGVGWPGGRVSARGWPTARQRAFAPP